MYNRRYYQVEKLLGPLVKSSTSVIYWTLCVTKLFSIYTFWNSMSSSFISAFEATDSNTFSFLLSLLFSIESAHYRLSRFANVGFPISEFSIGIVLADTTLLRKQQTRIFHMTEAIINKVSKAPPITPKTM